MRDMYFKEAGAVEISLQETLSCGQMDPEILPPANTDTASRTGRMVCLVCDMGDSCLQYALENDGRYGIFATTS